MLKRIFITVFFFLHYFLLFSQQKEEKYEQDVHMYITMQAFELLRQTNYYPLMGQYLGTMNDIGDPHFDWTGGKVTTGAYMEDQFDCVFGHTGFNISNSHFWTADNRFDPEDPNLYTGDYTRTHLHGVGYFKNAYEKISLYKDGNWYDGSNSPIYIELPIVDNGNLIIVGLMYRNGLINLFKDGNVWWEYFYVYNNPSIYGYARRWVTLDQSQRYRLVWEILGRMCHLLQDMTVPAHSHGAVHIDDCYEKTYIPLHFTEYNANTAGQMIDPYVNSYGNPIRYLLYVANQLGDFWPVDVDCYETEPRWYGNKTLFNNINGEGTYPILADYYNQLGNPPTVVNPSQQAQWEMNHAIRATAGLLKWFAVEAGLNQSDPIPTNVYITPNRLPAYNIPGQSVVLKGNATGSNYWFSWFYRTCSFEMPPYGILPQNGIRYTISSSTEHANQYFTVYNDSYNGQNCIFPQKDNSLSGAPFELNKLSVWAAVQACNEAGCSSMSQPFPVQNGPINNPIGGCPYLFFQASDYLVYTENNLLHKSEFPEFINMDITDKYVLKNEPLCWNGKICLVIQEMNNHKDYFDKISLYSISHPVGSKIAITEDNRIVMFDSAQVISTDNSFLNGIDITQNIQYHFPPRNAVTGDTSDYIYTHFNSHSMNSPGIIMEWEKDPVIHITPNAKDWFGNMNIHTNNGSISRNISRRENFSANVIPVDQLGRNINIDYLNFNIYNNYHVKYIALSELSYDGFGINELPLIEAKVVYGFAESNVDSLLRNVDQNYAIIDSVLDHSLVMFFSKDIDNLAPTQVTDYLLEITGKYLISNNDKKGINNKIRLKEKPILTGNYPNPFNPKTIIKFYCPYFSKVKIVVYDLLGREIAILLDDTKQAGNYSVIFDASNLASGVYFYKMETSDFTDVKKMVVLK